MTAKLLLVVSAVFLLGQGVLDASTPQKKQQAREQFDRAEAARAALQAKPAEDRRPSDYDAALKAYHSVVRLAPTIKQAPESLFRAAQLQQDMAQRFSKDKKSREYRAEARRLYEFLIKEYPQNRNLPQAKKALEELDVKVAAVEEAPAPPSQKAALVPASVPVSAPGRGKLVQVSNVRQWSTPSYTRVAIDLEEEVKFEAGRISNPDRIYFDLHNTHLASSVKSLDVQDGLLKKIRLGENRQGITRVVLEVGEIGTYSAFLLPNPYRLIIDIQGAAKTPPATTKAEAAPNPGRLPLFAIRPRETVKTAPQEENTSGPKAEDAPTPANPAPVSAPPPSIRTPKSEEVPTTKGPTSKPVYDSGKPVAVATPSSPARDGHRSLTRALGLKIGRIVIDPGHGGHDTGTIGPSGFAEKELVLDVAKRLGALVEERMGSEVVYTRDDDTFIPLESRTGIANQKQADLFVSVHANASRDTKARGVETYYLSFTTSSDALEVAARENAVSEKSVHELQDLVKKITLHEKVDESREFAAEVQKQLFTGISRGNTGMRNRGVRKAPFIVLIGANMPSILAEISFVSNPQDERLLKKPEYRQRIAESLFRGIQRYATSLGSVKVAKN